MGGGQGQGSIASSGLACPSHSLQLLTGVVKPAKPVLLSGPKDRAQSCRSRHGQPPQEPGTGKTERLRPTCQPSPEVSSVLGVRLVLSSTQSFVSLECCVSGLARAVLQPLPSCWGQPTFCLAVSLCKKPEVGLRNKTEGREGGKNDRDHPETLWDQEASDRQEGFMKSLGSCEQVCLPDSRGCLLSQPKSSYER